MPTHVYAGTSCFSTATARPSASLEFAERATASLIFATTGSSVRSSYR